MYYTSNNDYFHDIYKNLENKKCDYKNNEIDIEFNSISYYIIMNKIEKEFLFNN